MRSSLPGVLTIFLMVSILKQGIAAPATSYWTNWYDRDNPSGTGDWEVTWLAKQLYSDMCDSPTAIQCRVRGSHIPWQNTGESFQTPCTVQGGLVCKNRDQPDGYCLDYEVRYFCSPGVTSTQSPTTTATTAGHDCGENNPCTQANINQGHFYFQYNADQHKFVQCDAWGSCFIRPCAPGTVWSTTAYTCVSSGK